MDTARLTTSSAPISSIKLCRYGDNCSRPGCRFKHSFDNVTMQTPTKNLYCSNNWLPHKIKMTLKKEELCIEKVQTNEVNEFLLLAKLISAVHHIKLILRKYRLYVIVGIEGEYAKCSRAKEF